MDPQAAEQKRLEKEKLIEQGRKRLEQYRLRNTPSPGTNKLKNTPDLNSQVPNNNNTKPQQPQYLCLDESVSKNHEQQNPEIVSPPTPDADEAERLQGDGTPEVNKAKLNKKVGNLELITPTATPVSTPVIPSTRKRMKKVRKDFEDAFEIEMNHDMLARQYRDLEARQKENEDTVSTNHDLIESLKSKLSSAEQANDSLLNRIHDAEKSFEKERNVLKKEVENQKTIADSMRAEVQVLAEQLETRAREAVDRLMEHKSEDSADFLQLRVEMEEIKKKMKLSEEAYQNDMEKSNLMLNQKESELQKAQAMYDELMNQKNSELQKAQAMYDELVARTDKLETAVGVLKLEKEKSNKIFISQIAKKDKDLSVVKKTLYDIKAEAKQIKETYENQASEHILKIEAENKMFAEMLLQLEQKMFEKEETLEAEQKEKAKLLLSHENLKEENKIYVETLEKYKEKEADWEKIRLKEKETYENEAKSLKCEIKKKKEKEYLKKANEKEYLLEIEALKKEIESLKKDHTKNLDHTRRKHRSEIDALSSELKNSWRMQKETECQLKQMHSRLEEKTREFDRVSKKIEDDSAFEIGELRKLYETRQEQDALIIENLKSQAQEQNEIQGGMVLVKKELIEKQKQKLRTEYEIKLENYSEENEKHRQMYTLEKHKREHCLRELDKLAKELRIVKEEYTEKLQEEGKKYQDLVIRSTQMQEKIEAEHQLQIFKLSTDIARLRSEVSVSNKITNSTISDGSEFEVFRLSELEPSNKIEARLKGRIEQLQSEVDSVNETLQSQCKQYSDLEIVCQKQHDMIQLIQNEDERARTIHQLTLELEDSKGLVDEIDETKKKLVDAESREKTEKDARRLAEARVEEISTLFKQCFYKTNPSKNETRGI